MFGGIASKIVTLAKKGSAADVTPNAVDWGDMTYRDTVDTSTFREQQITGINQTITLRIKTTSSCASFIYYRVANTPSSGYYDGDAVEVGTYLYYADYLIDGSYLGVSSCALNTTGFTISVSNNQYVGLSVAYGDVTPLTIQVVNESDGNAILDSFTLTTVSDL